MQRKGLNGLAFAKLACVPQYAISRLLTGRIKNISPDIEKAVFYAKNAVYEAPKDDSQDPSPRTTLEAAIYRVWDGTPQHAKLLVMAIEALAPVLQRSSST